MTPQIDPPPPVVECHYCLDSVVCSRCLGSGCDFCVDSGLCVYCMTALQESSLADIEERMRSHSLDYDCRKNRSQ